MLGWFRNLFADLRLALAAIAGGLIYWAMPPLLPPAMRGAIGWDAGVAFFLARLIAR